MVRKKKIPPQPTAEQTLDLDYMGSREEVAESRTVASRKRLREQVDNEVERFLAHGGSINQVDPYVTAVPVTKPSSHYGDRPI